jgi:hypothetical protein
MLRCVKPDGKAFDENYTTIEEVMNVYTHANKIRNDRITHIIENLNSKNLMESMKQICVLCEHRFKLRLSGDPDLCEQFYGDLPMLGLHIPMPTFTFSPSQIEAMNASKHVNVSVNDEEPHGDFSFPYDPVTVVGIKPNLDDDEYVDALNDVMKHEHGLIVKSGRLYKPLESVIVYDWAPKVIPNFEHFMYDEYSRVRTDTPYEYVRSLAAKRPRSEDDKNNINEPNKRARSK